MNYRKPSQFELFPGTLDVNRSEIKKSLFKEIIVAPENIIITSIFLMLLFVLFYSFGIEKGKGIARQQMITEMKIKAAQIAAANTLNASKNLENKPLVSASSHTSANKPTQQKKLEQNSKNAILTPTQPAQTKPSSGQYTVQVAMYKTKDLAVKSGLLLQQKGFNVVIVSKADTFFVCVGKFSSTEEAKKYSQRLKGKNSEFIIRRI